ncbi:MAG: GNAT family N-acetyltransferase, partial [Fimbriimonadaceae bacterium]
DIGRLDRHPDRYVVRQAVGDEVGPALEVFFDTHARRWRRRGLPGAFVGRRMRRFHEEWAAAADKRGLLRLSVLEVDGEPVGAVYAMRTQSTTFFYQSGFDPRHRSVSPGSLLVAAAIRRAVEDGCRSFDFLRGDEPYKRRWGPQHSIPNLRILAPTGGTLGRLGRSVNKFGFAVEKRIRSRLEGRSLWRASSRARSDDRSRR